MNHSSPATLSRMARDHTRFGLPQTLLTPGDLYYAAVALKENGKFPHTSRTSRPPSEHSIELDIIGPQAKHEHGYQYKLVTVELQSRAAHVHFLKKKSDAEQAIVKNLTHITSFQCTNHLPSICKS